jgi:hypothetical protein
MTPITPPTDYTIRWEAMAATLRKQAAQFDLSLQDRRDASYWAIVTPLFEETISQSFHERFLCDCGDDHTRLWAWVELAQDEFGLTFYLTEFTGESTLAYRLKTAWNVLRGRSIEFGLIFDPKDLPRLKALINRLP